MASLTGLFSLPGVSATEPGDLRLVATNSPMEDSWSSSWENMRFNVTVTNEGLQAISNRGLWWYACEGEVESGLCVSTYDERGSFSLTTIYPGETEDYESSNLWNPSGDEGAFTIVYAFDDNDQDPSDDVLSFTINLTRSFVDLAVDPLYEPTSTLSNLGYDGSQAILNTDTDYTMNAKGTITACATCNFAADIGWQLWSSDGQIMISEAFTTFSDLPAWGGISPLNEVMPDFTHPDEGTFLLRWGLIGGTGTPYGDLVPDNDMAEVIVVLDNTIDLQASSMIPGHNPTSMDYYYGDEMVHSVLQNNGYVSIASTTVTFQIFDQLGEVESTSTCAVIDFHPGQERTCKFDVTLRGEGKTLAISVPTVFAEGSDSKPGDNSLTENADLLSGSINAAITQSNSQGIYTTGEDIVMVARVGDTAAAPLNYSWWQSGIIGLGYGPILNVSGSVLGLGDHIVTLRVVDAFGELESAHVDITLFNYVSLDNGNLFSGEAVTRSLSYLEHEAILPVLGTQYGIGEGREPLLLLSFDILSSADDSNNTGLERMNIHLNTSNLLPDNIPLDTVDVRFLPGLDQNIWTYLDQYTKNPDHSFDVTLNENGVLLLIGVAPPANISSGPIQYQQRQGGSIELEWNPEGDTDNPYIGSWNIYKLTVSNSAGTIFPDPNADFNQNVWEQLTETTLVASLHPSLSGWVDPSPLPTGICASYAVMPADREGTPDFLNIEVSRDDNGQPIAYCGDAVAPDKILTNIRVSTSFTNDTECYKIMNDWSMCYDVNVSWVWPEHETTGDITWNLYRTDQRPDGIDISFLTPMEEGLTGVPGEKGYFNQSGINDENIRPYRTYYYIFAPVDSVGNQLNEASYPTNAIRVTIEDQWWDYNQHLIPEPEPEPEPPLGVEWLGTLTDYMEVEEFQMTGAIALLTLVVSMISLPIVIRKRKRLARIMKARKKREGSQATAEELEDFFD